MVVFFFDIKNKEVTTVFSKNYCKNSFLYSNLLVKRHFYYICPNIWPFPVILIFYKIQTTMCKTFWEFRNFKGRKINFWKILKFRRLISRKPFEIEHFRFYHSEWNSISHFEMTFSRASWLLPATRLRSGARGGSQRGGRSPPLCQRRKFAFLGA